MNTATNIVRALILIVLLSTLSYAGGFEIGGVGAQATGMSGAFRAVADDWSAAYYNPAGYAYILDNSFGVNWSFVHHRNEIDPAYEIDGGLPQPYSWGHFNNSTINNFHQVLANPSAGLVLRTPLFGETVFGISAYQPFDYTSAWQLFQIPQSYNRDVQVRDEQYKNDLDVVAFQLTAGREITPEKLSFGIGLQLMRVDLFFRDLYLRPNPLSSPFSDRNWDHLPELTTNEGTGWGFGFRTGLLWKAAEKVRVGITAAVPFKTTVSGDAEFMFVMPSTATDSDFDRYQPGTVERLFSNGDVVSYSSEFEAKLKLPPSFGLGVAFDVTDRLLISLDGQYTLWSQYEGLSFDYSNFDFSSISQAQFKNPRPDSIISFFAADLARPVSWDNTFKVAAGLRYRLADFAQFVGGASFDQAPSSDFSDLTPQFFDTGDKLGLSGGFIFHINEWDLSMISSWTDLPDETVDGLQDFDGNGIDDNFPGNYRGETFETVFSLNYRF